MTNIKVTNMKNTAGKSANYTVLFNSCQHLKKEVNIKFVFEDVQFVSEQVRQTYDAGRTAVKQMYI